MEERGEVEQAKEERVLQRGNPDSDAAVVFPLEREVETLKAGEVKEWKLESWAE